MAASSPPLVVLERVEGALWVAVADDGFVGHAVDALGERAAEVLGAGEIAALRDVETSLFVEEPWFFSDGVDTPMGFTGVAWIAFEDPVADAEVFVVHRELAGAGEPEHLLVVRSDDRAASKWQREVWAMMQRGQGWLGGRFDVEPVDDDVPLTSFDPFDALQDLSSLDEAVRVWFQLAYGEVDGIAAEIREAELSILHEVSAGSLGDPQQIVGGLAALSARLLDLRRKGDGMRELARSDDPMQSRLRTESSPWLQEDPDDGEGLVELPGADDVRVAAANLVQRVDAQREQLRSTFDMVAQAVAAEQLQVARDERLASNKLQTTITVFGAALLVPTLIASVYGANVRAFDPEKPESLLGLLALMLGSAVGTYTLIRRIQGERWSPVRLSPETASALAALLILGGAGIAFAAFADASGAERVAYLALCAAMLLAGLSVRRDARPPPLDPSDPSRED